MMVPTQWPPCSVLGTVLEIGISIFCVLEMRDRGPEGLRDLTEVDLRAGCTAESLELPPRSVLGNGPGWTLPSARLTDGKSGAKAADVRGVGAGARPCSQPSPVCPAAPQIPVALEDARVSFCVSFPHS